MTAIWCCAAWARFRGIRNLGFAIGSVNRQHILYNFYEATELTLDDDRNQGRILAPYARVTFVKGRMNGTLISAALIGTGIAWPAPFIGQLPMPHDNVPISGRSDLAPTSMPTTAVAAGRRPA